MIRILAPESHRLVTVRPAAADHTPRLLGAVGAAFTTMAEAAARDEVVLAAVSGFRDIDRQTAIWNAKVDRSRAAGRSLEQAIDEALEFSAPPGWSRHHWGTDLDLVGGVLVTAARLEPEDWEPGGPCAEAGTWLGTHAADFGFLRPYDEERGGYRPEPWHWSFAPIAVPWLDRLAGVNWSEWLAREPYAGSRVIASRFDDLYPRFVHGIAPQLRRRSASER